MNSDPKTTLRETVLQKLALHDATGESLEEANTGSPEIGRPVKRREEARVYEWRDGAWIRLPGFCSTTKDFLTAKLRTSAGTINMYIHDVGDDIHVSGSIKRTGLWDSNGVYTMISRLKKNPEMGVIDIGSQLGTFALVSAMLGRDVIAVDPLRENVLRLCKTIEENNLTSKVTILYSAVSSTRRTVSFNRLRNNIGGTHLADIPKNKTIVRVDDSPQNKYINTVVLDDILPFINFQKAFVKIDVEGHEFEALKEGKELFTKVDINWILMEWFQIKATKKGYNLNQLLTKFDLIPSNPLTGTSLSNMKPSTWPNDILWYKSSEQR